MVVCIDSCTPAGALMGDHYDNDIIVQREKTVSAVWVSNWSSKVSYPAALNCCLSVHNTSCKFN